MIAALWAVLSIDTAALGALAILVVRLRREQAAVRNILHGGGGGDS